MAYVKKNLLEELFIRKKKKLRHKKKITKQSKKCGQSKEFQQPS